MGYKHKKGILTTCENGNEMVLENFLRTLMLPFGNLVKYEAAVIERKIFANGKLKFTHHGVCVCRFTYV